MEDKKLTKCFEKVFSEDENVEYRILYSTSCPFSINAINMLKSQNVRFKGYDIDNMRHNLKDILVSLRNVDFENKTSLDSHNTKPIIFHKQTFLGGFDELKEHFS